MNTPSTIEMELAVIDAMGGARHFFAVVPNISWGLGMHECDLLFVRPTGYCIEVEIKRTLSDLRADRKKWHGHRDQRIKQLFFAVPAHFAEEAVDIIPDGAGLFMVVQPHGKTSKTWRAELLLDACSRPNSKPLTAKEMLKVGRLAALRIWSLKKTLIAKEQV